MKRSPASVVVVAAAGPVGRQRAEAAVSALRPSLGARDEVIVVADGSPAVAALPTSAGLEDRRRAGLQFAIHDVVLLVCADMVPPRHAVDGLVAAVDAGAAAAGPAGDLSIGPAQVCPPLEALGRPDAFRAWSSRWRQEHREERLAVPSLAEAVVAAPRATLLEDCAPGFGERLCRYGDLVVVGDSAWHHRGADGCGLAPEDRPLLSAVLIVKDEQESIGACLDALDGVCDEVVVYDTGSSDDTVEIARSRQARVVLGYWDDHFGDARNRALAHAHGRWFLQVDADEIVDVADRAAFRRELVAVAAEALSIEVESRTTNGHGTPYISAARRLGRRDALWFAGRIHEQMLSREGRLPHTVLLQGVRIVHHGYVAARTAARGKSSRNLRLATLALDDAVPPGLTRGDILSNLVRSLKLAGDDEGVLERAAASLDDEGTPMSRRDIAATAARAAGALQRFDVAHQWVDRLAATSTSPSRVNEISVAVLVAEGRAEEAARVLAGMPESSIDDDGREVRRDVSLAQEVAALLQLRREAEAGERIIDVTRRGSLNLPLGRVMDVLMRTAGQAAAYARVLPEPMLLTTLAEAATLPPEIADELLDALWAAGRRPAAVLAVATDVAPRLPVLRSLEWSVRLRSHGAPDECPLVRLAESAGRSPRDRVIAAAVALESFDDQRALPVFVAAADDVPDELTGTVAAELRVLTPRVAQMLLAG